MSSVERNESGYVVKRRIIADELERFDLIGDNAEDTNRPFGRIAVKMADSVLDALAEAGFVLVERPVDGSDRVIRWETTTCPRCLGTDSDRQFCDDCDGSGRGPETVTLHRLVQYSTATLDDGYGSSYYFTPGNNPVSASYRPATTFPTYRLVPVDTSVPAEPAAALPEETP